MSRNAGHLPIVLLVVAFAPATVFCETIPVGQTDKFADGTPQGWGVGAPHPSPPINVSSGGPDGVGDNYLRLSAIGGGGPGSRLAAFNGSQWSGDLLSGGVTTISADLNNLGDSSLEIRLLLQHTGGTRFVSNESFSLPPNSDWQSANFALTSDAMTRVQGASTLDTTLGDLGFLWIFHNGDASFPPPPIVATLGVDNIAAVPEPSAALLCGIGALMLLAYNRRRRRITG